MAVLAILATLALTLVVTTPTTAIEYILSATQDVSLGLDFNLDGYNQLLVGYHSDTKVRSLVQFDLSPLPPSCTGENLQSATMDLYYSQTFPGVTTHRIEVYCVLQPWDEMQATKTFRLAGIPWSVPCLGLNGIDAEQQPISTVSQDTPPAQDHVFFDIRDAVIAWIENGQPNNGLLLKAEKETPSPGALTKLIAFATKDAPPDEQPKVRVVCSA